jgi:hypothetical protein
VRKLRSRHRVFRQPAPGQEPRLRSALLDWQPSPRAEKCGEKLALNRAHSGAGTGFFKNYVTACGVRRSVSTDRDFASCPFIKICELPHIVIVVNRAMMSAVPSQRGRRRCTCRICFWSCLRCVSSCHGGGRSDRALVKTPRLQKCFAGLGRTRTNAVTYAPEFRHVSRPKEGTDALKRTRK